MILRWVLPAFLYISLIGCANIKYTTSVTLTCDPENPDCDRYNLFNYAASITADWPKYPFYTRDEYIYMRHQPNIAKSQMYDYVLKKREENQKWNRFVFCAIRYGNCAEPFTLDKKWLTQREK